MKRELKEKLQEEIKQLICLGYNDYQIGRKLKIHRSIVYRFRNKFEQSLGFMNQRDLIDRFEIEYRKMELSFEASKTRLNELKLAAEGAEDYVEAARIEVEIHKIDVDKLKLLEDNDLVLAIRKIKNDRILNQNTQGTRESREEPIST